MDTRRTRPDPPVYERRGGRVTPRAEEPAGGAVRRGRNACSEAFLAPLVGKVVCLTLPSGESVTGDLMDFDSYSVRIRTDDIEGLYFRGPGLSLSVEKES